MRPLKMVVESLTKNGVKFTVFDRVGVEPTDATMRDAIAFARKGHYDAYVAVGGGSVMVCAHLRNHS